MMKRFLLLAMLSVSCSDSVGPDVTGKYVLARVDGERVGVGILNPVQGSGVHELWGTLELHEDGWYEMTDSLRVHRASGLVDVYGDTETGSWRRTGGEIELHSSDAPFPTEARMVGDSLFVGQSRAYIRS